METYKEVMDKKAKAQRIIDDNLENIAENLLKTGSERTEIDNIDIKLIDLGKGVIEIEKSIKAELSELKNRVKALENRE